MHATKLLVLTGVTALAPLALATTPPSTCQYKVFVDGYPNPACAVPNVGTVGVDLTVGLFLAPGECKDTSKPVLSFRDAISNDAKAKTCTLTAYDQTGCKGKAFNQQPHVEADENQCVDYSLSSGNALGAKSFSLKC